MPAPRVACRSTIEGSGRAWSRAWVIARAARPRLFRHSGSQMMRPLHFPMPSRSMQNRQRGAQRLSRGGAALALLLTVPPIGAASSAWGQAPTVVRTRSGNVSGTAAKLPGVRAYLGIPFAAPPVGDRRWRAPGPVTAWKGTRAADHFSPSCIQGPNTPFGPWTAEFLLLGPTSEDCLYLNVWTAAKPNARQPVLVYIYGGGFGSGSGDVPVYDGSHLAAERWTSRGEHELPRRRARLPRASRAHEGSGGIGQLRSDGPGRGARVGTGQHRGIRRRSAAAS